MAVVFEKPKALTDAVFHYCPGCTHGIIHRLVAEAIDTLGIEGRTIGIAPVGCSVLAYDYFTCDMVEASHGRAPAVATGVKRSLPDVHAEVPVYLTENVLYPVLFCAGSEAEASTLLLSSIKAATEKYALDTDVHVILKNSIYEKLCTYILPEKRINSKLLIADVSEYKKSDSV